ncbi:hypothetical protein AMELA_G00236210 [Ameiurus melas]|uniref:Protein kinase domain-containing protein n=1 Tax=Ameiurus melas TaxID=219545 RepID=A0A7J5ZU35_AMEME|nr:hypothetical protein AMELA_G00236210 [Ameiurus melas]
MDLYVPAVCAFTALHLCSSAFTRHRVILDNWRCFFRSLRRKKKNKVRPGVDDETQAAAQPPKQPEESATCDGDVALPLDHTEQELKPSSSPNEGHSAERRENELQPKRMSLEEFNFLSVLGRGEFSKVILSELRGTDEVYALKMLKKDRILACNDLKYTLMERRILVLASEHPYLTHLFCCFQTTEYLCFGMEYVKGGDLSYHLERSGGFDEPRSQFYAAEIACALMFLHRTGIVHRDLKPKNILVDADGHCKLADFGLCKETFQDVKMTFCGTPKYISPEMIRGSKCSTSVDWWALGVILFEMLTGYRPFDCEHRRKLFDSIVKDKPKYPSSLSKNAVSILKGFLRKNPKTRLGCVISRRGREEAIKVHPFFQPINWMLLERRKIMPPFKSLITTKSDVNNFSDVFTREEPKLSLVDHSIIEKYSQEMFRDFSYINTMH